jgi:hypothetical protein
VRETFEIVERQISEPEIDKAGSGQVHGTLMEQWSYKNLGDATMAHVALDRIEKAFRAEHGMGGLPSDVAAFIRHRSEGRLHCQVEVYFSPAAVKIAGEFGAESCGRPQREGLGMLIGSEDSWSTLFCDGVQKL